MSLCRLNVPVANSHNFQYMPARIFVAVGLLWGCLLPEVHGQQHPADGPYRARFRDAPLAEVLSFFEEKYRLSFSYDPQLVAPLRVTAHFTEGKLEKAMYSLLEGTPLHFEILDGGYILLLPADIPPTGTTPPLPSSPNVLCGTVLDAESGLPLPGAVAYVEGSSSGTTTDPAGAFRLSGHFQPSDSLRISFLGYTPQAVALSEVMNRPCSEWRLHIQTFTFPDVVIREFSVDMIGLRNDGSIGLRNEKLPTLPGWGEPDVLRTLQFLPGIGNADGAAARLNVRGGTSDQNLVLWEAIPIYHTGHFFGIYDAFNPSVVKNVAVWRGNFGARYGGRNSAVIDITGEPAYASKTRWGFGFNLLHLNAFLEKPLKKERVTLQAAMRSSYVNLIESTSYRSLVNQVFQNGRITLQESFRDESEFVSWTPTFHYGDLNLSLRWKGRRGSDNQVTLFSTSDVFDYRFTYDDSVQYTTTLDHLKAENTGMSWQHSAQWSDAFRVEYQVAASNYANDYFFQWSNLSERPFNYRWNTYNRMGDFSTQLHHHWDVNPEHSFSFGYQLGAAKASLVYSDTNTVLLTGGHYIDDTTSQVLHTFYGEFAYRPSANFSFTVGLRENYSPSRKLCYSEPRIRFQWKPFGENFSLKGGFGRHWQFVFQVMNFSDLGVGEPLWAIANQQIPAQESWQWNAGLSWETKTLLLDLELYQKKGRNLTSLNLELDSGVERPWVFDGELDAAGLDFLLRKRWHRYSIWASGSVADTRNRFNSLNNGNPFPAPHDIRHNFDLVQMYSSGRWDWSFNFHVNSGRPYSVPEVEQVPCPECLTDTATYQLTYSTLNQQRLPTTIRLDIGTTYRFGGRRMKGKVGFAMYNLLHRRNVLDKDFFLETPPISDPQTAYDLRTLDRRATGATPNLFLQFKW